MRRWAWRGAIFGFQRAECTGRGATLVWFDHMAGGGEGGVEVGEFQKFWPVGLVPGVIGEIINQALSKKS
jgi:hypothetical protein